MSMIQNFVENIIDSWFCFWPQKLQALPSTNIQIVAHRGFHKKNIKENTLSAFQICLDHSIWGIEFDIQWTQDLVPVVHHDSHCKRVFKKDLTISQVTFSELNKQIPEIPTLEEVIQKYGKKIHFMIELKEEPFLEAPDELINFKRNKILHKLLSPLKPIKDYHLMSLNPQVFNFLKGFETLCFLNISLTNAKELFQKTLSSPFGGLTGHYLLLTPLMRKRLLQAHKKVGVGFISSKNSLIRELNLGAQWIFTNDPLLISAYAKELEVSQKTD